MIKGLYTALVSPFIDGRLNKDMLKKLILQQLEANVDGIALLGTTGEVLTLSGQERQEVVKVAAEVVQSNAHLMVGCPYLNTQEVIEWSSFCRQNGASSLLCLPPYYIRPSSQGIRDYYLYICSHSKLPIVLYNNPSRAATTLEIEAIEMALNHPNCLGIKEADCSKDRLDNLLSLKKKSKNEFSILSGDDDYLVNKQNMDLDGSVAVISNIVPGQVMRLLKGDLTDNLILKQMLHTLNLEGNPVAIKKALEVIGLDVGSCRLPLGQFNPTLINEFTERLSQCMAF